MCFIFKFAEWDLGELIHMLYLIEFPYCSKIQGRIPSSEDEVLGDSQDNLGDYSDFFYCPCLLPFRHWLPRYYPHIFLIITPTDSLIEAHFLGPICKKRSDRLQRNMWIFLGLQNTHRSQLGGLLVNW